MVHRRLQVRRDPVGDAYGSLEHFPADEPVAPLLLDVPPLDLAELMRA